MKHVGIRVLALSFAIVGGGACSESTPDPLSNDGGASTALTPSSACSDTVDSIYADPGALPSDAASRGNVLRCAKDKALTKDEMQAKIAGLGYTGKLTSGAQSYRVSFRTERGNAANTPGVSSAMVYIPDTPRAAKLPVVIAGRGSRGQAPQCAASKLDASLENGGVNEDYYRLAYGLAGNGYAVIVPDLAGYANFGAANNPPSAYAQAADVAKSTLDGGRALKKLFPALDDKVVLVGHSQGGHSVLAALAYADTYGTAAPIVGVAAYAPLWLSQRSWGALLYRPVAKQLGYTLASGSLAAVDVWYHYTQAELLDGPGEGAKLFAADKRAAIKQFVDTTCWGAAYPALTSQGTYIDELYDPAFVSEVGLTSTQEGNPCAPGTVCEKWLARYSADRPHLTGKAATTPILIAYGGKDTTIPPERMKCGLDRLQQDNAQKTVCFEPDLTHNTIVSGKADYVAEWIASVALGGAAPAACAQNDSAITVACATPPPND